MLTNRTLLLLATGQLIGYAAAAQTPAAAPLKPAPPSEQELLFWLLLSLLGLLLLALLGTGIVIARQLKPQLRALYDQPLVHASWSGQVLGLLVGDARLVQGDVRDELLDHDYDGIHEFDNDLPPWWTYGFAFTAVFAVVYMFYYHVGRQGQLQEAEYAVEMQQAALFVPAGTDDPNQLTTYTALTAPADISSGKRASRVAAKVRFC